MQNKDDGRKAFREFCETVRNIESDKDKFLAAAHLQRIERQPTFTAAQLIGFALLMGMLLLGSVAIICLTLAGKTGCILPVLFATLVAVFLAGAMAIGGI